MAKCSEPKLPELKQRKIIKIWKEGKWKCLSICVDCGRERTDRLSVMQSRDTCRCHTVEHIRDTMLQNYGVANASELQEVVDKRKAASLARFGTTSPTQHPDIKAKIRESCLKRYGETSHMKTPEAKDKLAAIMQDKYGVSNCSQAEEVKAKKREKSQAVYGVDCPLQAQSIKDRIKATCVERYGGENPMHSPEVVDRALRSSAATKRTNGYRSAGELELEQFILSLGLKPTHYASGAREIDVYIESRHVGIEYHGEYWHSEKHGRTASYHKHKMVLAEAAGITLLQIWAHLYQERTRQVQDFIKAKLGCCTNKIGARKCNILHINIAEAKEFMQEYHIQAAPSHITLALGAYHKGELLAVATFGPHHRTGAEVIVLNRLCTKADWIVSGFLGKAMSIASSHYKADIVSWVDLMWSNGASYIKAGFIQDAVLQPDYFYVTNSGRKVIKKQSFRKIDERTELQRAIDEGMSRVWDCGKIRFRYKFKES